VIYLTSSEQIGGLFYPLRTNERSLHANGKTGLCRNRDDVIGSLDPLLCRILSGERWLRLSQ
jgi:hypothetical protein